MGNAEMERIAAAALIRAYVNLLCVPAAVYSQVFAIDET